MQGTIPLLLLLGAAVALAPTAAAHDHIMVGKYELTVGYESEPPVVDVLNAVSVRIKGPDLPPFDSGNLAPGATFSHTFKDAGNVEYHCHLHPAMTGHVTVTAAGHGAAKTHHVEIASFAFTPKNVTVAAGDTVKWWNNDTVLHTVTEGRMTDGHGHDHHGEGDDHAAPTRPISGLEGTLKITLVTGGVEKQLEVTPKFRDPGHYVARFIPTVPGGYVILIKGNVEGQAIDQRVDYSHEPILKRSELEFPRATASNADVAKQLADLSKDTDALANATGGIRPAPAPAALLVLGLVALAGLLVGRRR